MIKPSWTVERHFKSDDFVDDHLNSSVKPFQIGYKGTLIFMIFDFIPGSRSLGRMRVEK